MHGLIRYTQAPGGARGRPRKDKQIHGGEPSWDRFIWFTMLGRGTGTPPPCNFADAKLWRGRLSSFARPKESTSNGDAGGPAVPEATALRRPAREDVRVRRGVEVQARDEYYEEPRGRGGCLG